MKLSKCLIAMIIVTTMSLIYIKLQVQIVDLAYQGRSKEGEMRKILDDNGDMFYNISTLKSANHLGVKLLTDQSDMRFLDHDQIVEMRVPYKSASRYELVSKVPRKSPINFLVNIFSLKSQAEAKTIK